MEVHYLQFQACDLWATESLHKAQLLILFVFQKNWYRFCIDPLFFKQIWPL